MKHSRCLTVKVFNGPVFLCCSTVSSILGAWLDQYSEDFWSPPNYDCLHQLLSYLHCHLPGSDLERRARNLLAHFHRRQQCEPDPDGMKAGQERAGLKTVVTSRCRNSLGSEVAAAEQDVCLARAHVEASP